MLASKIYRNLDVFNGDGVLVLVNTVTGGKSTKLWGPVDLIVDIKEVFLQPTEDLNLIAIFKLSVFHCLVLKICRNHGDFSQRQLSDE